MNPVPKVSILLPNLNTRKYLDQRMDSIFKQTFTDWELVIVDNESDDVAWDFFKKIAASDIRVRISQATRNGMYANWNNCIDLARGEYAYIATSDDTMAPECLEHMVAALDSHPQCDIAHCCLTIIDENGEPLSQQWNQLDKVLFYGDFIKRMHIRKAPYDAYVHAGWSVVYHSITQLLIRRSLFNKVGLFRNDLGSIADFEWEMRAAFIADVIHIPKYLATWRYHSAQATQAEYFHTADFCRKMIDMVESAFHQARSSNDRLGAKDLHALQHVYKRQWVGRTLRESPSIMERLFLFQKNIRSYPKETFEVLINNLSARKLYKLDITSYIRTMLENRKLENHILDVVQVPTGTKI